MACYMTMKLSNSTLIPPFGFTPLSKEMRHADIDIVMNGVNVNCFRPIYSIAIDGIFIDYAASRFI